MKRRFLAGFLVLAACSGSDSTEPTLARAAARVQVLDELGQPLITDVRLTAADGSTFLETTTPDSGWAHFNDVPVGDARIRPLLTAAWQMSGPEEQVLTVKTTLVARTQFVAELLAGMVTGAVVDSGGGVVGSVPVQLRRADGLVWTQLTTGVGTFQFLRVPVGSYTLTIADSTLTPRPIVPLEVRDDETRSALFTVAIPTTGSWSPAPPLQYPRGAHATVQVGTDVYVFGGEGPWTILEPRVERLRDGRWETVTRLPLPVQHAAAAEVDGRIYIFGGWDEELYTPARREVQIYDTRTGAWSAGTPLPTTNFTHTAAAVAGRIHVIGGDTDTRGHLVYDPATSAWSTRAKPPVTMNSVTSAVLDGKIYLLRGELLFIYDPAADRWTEGPMAHHSRYAAAALVRDGRLYVFGGRDPGGATTVVPEMYDPATGRWSDLRAMPYPRAELGGAVLADGIYLFGGAPARFEYYSTTGMRFTSR